MTLSGYKDLLEPFSPYSLLYMFPKCALSQVMQWANEQLKPSCSTAQHNIYLAPNFKQMDVEILLLCLQYYVKVLPSFISHFIGLDERFS